jgi:uncharacterized membrane protein
MEDITRAEAFVQALSPWLVHIVEACSVIVIFYGVTRAFLGSVLSLVRGPDKVPPTRVRLEMGRSLALALEFLLAADILETIISPTLQQVAILGGIAIIRTGLNYFLGKEIKEESEELRAEGRIDTPRGERRIAAAPVAAGGD